MAARGVGHRRGQGHGIVEGPFGTIPVVAGVAQVEEEQQVAGGWAGGAMGRWLGPSPGHRAQPLRDRDGFAPRPPDRRAGWSRGQAAAGDRDQAGIDHQGFGSRERQPLREESEGVGHAHLGRSQL